MKNFNELCQIQRSKLVAEVRISYYNQSKAPNFRKINSSTESESMFDKNWSDDMKPLKDFNV